MICWELYLVAIEVYVNCYIGMTMCIVVAGIVSLCIIECIDICVLVVDQSFPTYLFYPTLFHT